MEVFGYEFEEVPLLFAVGCTLLVAYQMFVLQLGGDWDVIPFSSKLVVVLAMPFVVYWVAYRMMNR